MLAFVPTGARRVLDVGCGEGGFGTELKRIRSAAGFDVEVVGVELESGPANVAAACLDKVVVADIERDDLGLAPQSFDCIVCNDVIEHLVSPWNALEKLRGLLAPDGVLVASIPNVRFWGVLKELLFNGDWRYVDEGVLDITHLRFLPVPRSDACSKRWITR